jgi:oxygen-dependent protoporphyrinogen oxidase
VRVLTGHAVRELARTPSGYRVDLSAAGAPGGLEADDVVLAVPAHVATRLLAPLAPAAAAAASAVEHTGVATLTLVYPRSALRRPMTGTGFLVPPVDRRLLVGCTWLSSKWPDLADDRVALIRCMVGRDGDASWAELDDAALLAAVRTELAASMGIVDAPSQVLVRRMPLAMPQYTVGHADRLAAIDGDLARCAGLHVTGAGYRGAGLASCITAAKACAQSVLARPVGLPEGAAR